MIYASFVAFQTNSVLEGLVAHVVVQDVAWFEGDRDRRRPVVGPVSFEVDKGKFFSVLGPPASGKTILLKIVAGLIQASQGEVFLAGRRVGSPQAGMGMASRDPALLAWRTVMGNVLLQTQMRGANATESEASARLLLASAGLAGFEDLRPDRLPVSALPWVAICRALVHKPELLLLDDPFASMDSLSREAVAVVFHRLWDATCTTVLLATQSIAEAVQLSDRVAVMSPRPGRIVGSLDIDLPRPRRLDKATTPKLTEFCNRIRNLFQAQGALP